jgi:DNA ligase (NAD+)
VEEEGRERAPEFRMPEECPACGTAVVIQGPFTICPNRFGCPAQLKKRIVHFGSRGALDIEGLGEETANLLVDRGLIKELSDLFGLDPEILKELPGFAELSANNLVEAIAARKRVELRRFLFGLGIPEVGEAVASDLAQHFRSLEAIREADRDALEAVDGIGPRMSELIVGFLGEDRNARAIDAVMARGMELLVPEEVGDAPLEGKKFVFTGTLERLTRSQAKKVVEGAGGKAVSSVSGETDYVVAGPGAGSKLDKAQDLGVTVWTEEEFLAFLREAGVDVEEEG